jgi:predicted nuclease of predicted toxin-antitoxin system
MTGHTVASRPVLFVDRSLGKGVGRVLQAAGASVAWHDDHFAQTTADADWIPEVSRRGWMILTKDKNIRRPHGEREDLLLAAARVLCLTSGNLSGAAMAQLFVDNLTAIESAANEPAPFVYLIGPGRFERFVF